MGKGTLDLCERVVRTRGRFLERVRSSEEERETELTGFNTRWRIYIPMSNGSS